MNRLIVTTHITSIAICLAVINFVLTVMQKIYLIKNKGGFFNGSSILITEPAREERLCYMRLYASGLCVFVRSYGLAVFVRPVQ